MARCWLDFWKSVCIQDDLSIRCVQMSTPIAASPLHGFLISGTSLFHGITSMFLSVLLCFAKTENTFGTLKWKRGSAPLALFVHVLVMHELCFARLPASVCRSVARSGRPMKWECFLSHRQGSCLFPAVLVMSGFQLNEILHPMENESETADKKWNH